MEMLYVLYDPKCELCERLKDWLLIQKQWLGLSMVPAGSDKAKKMFPDLDQIATCNDLVVISDDGQVYMNNSAWIMALYALEDYRDWACRLAHPLLRPFARQAFEALSKNRQAISRWLKGSPENAAEQLRKVTLPPCAIREGTVQDFLQ